MSRLQNLINGNSGTSYGARLNSLTPTQMTVPQIAPPIAEEKASQNNGGFFGGLGYLVKKSVLASSRALRVYGITPQAVLLSSLVLTIGLSSSLQAIG